MRKQFFRHNKKTSISEADKLIERYYEGLTSVEEEKRLGEFLSQPDLPERFEAEKAIFGYFGSKKQKKQFTLRPHIRWISVAAAAAIVVVSVLLRPTDTPTTYAYVNGRKITNIETIKSLALTSMTGIISENNEVEEGMRNIQGNELIESQLDVFSGVQF